MNRNMPDQSAAVYKDICKVDPTDTDAVKGEKDSTARASMARSQDSSGGFLKKDDAATLELEKSSRAAMTAEQLEEKRDGLIEEYNADVNNFDVSKRLADVYEQMEDWAMAHQMYEWAHSLSSGDVALKQKAGYMKDRAGDEEVKGLESRARENPDDEEARAQLEELQQGRSGFISAPRNPSLWQNNPSKKPSPRKLPPKTFPRI